MAKLKKRQSILEEMRLIASSIDLSFGVEAVGIYERAENGLRLFVAYFLAEESGRFDAEEKLQAYDRYVQKFPESMQMLLFVAMEELILASFTAQERAKLICDGLLN